MRCRIIELVREPEHTSVDVHSDFLRLANMPSHILGNVNVLEPGPSHSPTDFTQFKWQMQQTLLALVMAVKSGHLVR